MKLDRVIAVRTSKTVYRDGDDCIKVFCEDYSKGDILNEALNQARVETTGLNVPRVKAVTMVDGKWAIVSDYIKGKTLARLIEENPHKKSEYLSYFVDIQTFVHKHTCPMLTKLKDKMNRKISETELDATTRYDLHVRLENMPKHIKLCHGDFNPSNVILRESDGEPFIIDWAHVTQGNASADVARTYLCFWLAGDGETAEEYLNYFCQKTGTDKVYVKSWLPIVAASQSVKGRAAEREFLLSWVNRIYHDENE
ncbi:MAG: phosphotransferase [Candidatus Borkfalkiaceae bacterium]|nr:phosphotransferase [Christensenellaceae bacterium]